MLLDAAVRAFTLLDHDRSVRVSNGRNFEPNREHGELFSMKDAPFVEMPIAVDSTDVDALTARKALQSVLDKLNPSGGKREPENSGKAKPNKKKNKK